MPEKRIIKNSIITPDGTEIVSRHRHDCVFHEDENGGTYFVDGGLSYLRRGCPADKPCYKSSSVYLEDVSMEEAAKIAVWGSYGKKGDEPLRFTPICEMESSHIEAVLDECNPASQLREIMEWELKRRSYE